MRIGQADLVDGRIDSRRRLQARDLGKRGVRFVGATHLCQDIREQEILPRLIGLPGHGAALSLAGFLQFILSNAQQCHQIERFRIVHIEPAGVPKSCFGPR